jgi:hypothetical protein
MNERKLSLRPITFILIVSLALWQFFPGQRIVAAAETPAISSGDEVADDAVRGYLWTRYVHRTARGSEGTASDNDLFAELRLDTGREQRDRLAFHFFGVGRADLDGNQDRRSYYPLEDIGDAFASAATGSVYEAHLDINRPLRSVTQVRLGRQAGTRSEAVFFDGIAAELQPAAALHFTVYGGAAAHFYELDADWGADVLGGAGADYAPSRNTVLSLDYLYVTDELAGSTVETRRDQFAAARIWQRLTDSARGSLSYRMLNGSSRDVTARANQTFVGMGLELSAQYVRQFRTQDQLTTDLSPFTDVLGPSQPYQSLDVKLRQLLGRHVTADLGYFERKLLEATGQNAFNREYTRAFAVLGISDLFRQGLSFSLTGDRWEMNTASSSQKPSEYSTGADLGYAFKRQGRRGQVNAGTYYSLYRYDYYAQLGERTRVRVYYVNGKVPLGAHYSVNVSYECENGMDDFQTARIGLRRDF